MHKIPSTFSGGVSLLVLAGMLLVVAAAAGPWGGVLKTVAVILAIVLPAACLALLPVFGVDTATRWRVLSMLPAGFMFAAWLAMFGGYGRARSTVLPVVVAAGALSSAANLLAPGFGPRLMGLLYLTIYVFIFASGAVGVR